jgi:talin
MVKADANSPNQKRLKAAGSAVTSATNQLVKASEESQAFSESDSMVWTDSSIGSATASKVIEMEAQVFL